MKNILSIILFLSSLSAFAYEYPAAKRDRPIIEKALNMYDISFDELKFPLKRQIFTGTMTALTKIPELVSFLTGLGDQHFVTLHVIEGKFNHEQKTCIAYVQLNFDNTQEVEIANCGTHYTDFFSSKRLVPLTRP
ncbi:MAG: hypothetical protein KA715_12880 [Xanthomonadaceae bacterium]|nr:hypothetical protein [Xanthomonadaceae bacterium]